MLAGVAVIVSGWLGRYEFPVLGAVVAGGFFSFATTTYFPAFEVLGAGLVLAFLRSGQSRVNEGGDVR